MKGPILEAAVAQAHAHGARTVGHVGAATWAEAIAAGVDELAHGVMAFPEAHGGVIAPVTTMEAYASLLERSAAADLSAPAVVRALSAAAAARVVLTPTMVTSDILPRDPALRAAQAPYYSAAATAELDKRLAAPAPAVMARVLTKQMEFVAAAHKAGALLATGTDVTPLTLLPGFSLWREMELLARAGLRPADVLRAATANGAAALGRDGTLGTLRAGALADFVVLDADPLEDISNVRRVYRVVKNGVVYAPDDLRKRWIGRID
jgi:imidazolonepropionase-like amidohydrolase